MKFRELLCFGVLLLVCNYSIAQKNSKTKIATDTIPLPIPEVSIVGDCNFGISLIEIIIDEEDSTLSSKTFTLYKHNTATTPLDSLTDTIVEISTCDFEELQKRNFQIKPTKEGVYSIKVKQRKGGIFKESQPSKKLAISYCSAIEFFNTFDKSKVQAYTFKKLFNIQVIEFSIFDRIGETVYLYKNNNISWDGNYNSGQICPNGIYYYHCEYIDIADESKKKSQSGMIELTNSN